MNDAMRIRSRRRIVARGGLAAIIALTGLTACIFDKSDYQGGGRLDQGGSAQTAMPDASPAPTDTTTPTDDAAVTDPFADAGGVGAADG